MTTIAITLLISAAAAAALYVTLQSVMRGVSGARTIMAELGAYPADLRPAHTLLDTRGVNRLPACRRPARRTARQVAA